MCLQSSEIFVNIVFITIVILILGLALPILMVIYFRRKRIYLEEKVAMKQQFESELLKTHLEVQEQTMQTIAADLHDNIGQLLSLTTLTLNSINLKEPDKSEKKINNSLNLVHKSIKELRDLAKLLHGEQIVENGLGKAIKQELDRLKRIGNYKLKVNNQLLELTISSTNKDLIILRILQEIINNIIKHSGATHLEISTFLQNEKIHLYVRENGIGFNYEEIKKQKKGIGLYSIQKRVEMIDGEIDVKSETNNGTIITIEIPYP